LPNREFDVTRVANDINQILVILTLSPVILTQSKI
jgi:hypothetical protein